MFVEGLTEITWAKEFLFFLNAASSCLSLQSTGIIGLCHHAQQTREFDSPMWQEVIEG
jgi:hypothetical protein